MRHLLGISVNLGTRVNGNDTHYDIQGVLFMNHSRESGCFGETYLSIHEVYHVHMNHRSCRYLVLSKARCS